MSREEVFTTEATGFAEIGEFCHQELFTPRPESVLSEVEGRLRGAISEFRVTISAKWG